MVRLTLISLLTSLTAAGCGADDYLSRRSSDDAAPAAGRSLAAAGAAEGFVVETDKGKVQGKRETRFGKFTADTWQGIPYAAAPTGDRRFRAPEPMAAWTGVRDAKTYGSECLRLKDDKIGAAAPQTGLVPEDLVGKEDCLFLNVWSPAGAARQGEKHAVFVWFHGGGLVRGSGTGNDFMPPGGLCDGDESKLPSADFSKCLMAKLYNGTVMASNEKIVFVTANYRLGIYATFAHPAFADAKGRIGNNHLRDQVRVLEWVKANIAKFGGDPTQVTIGGHSGGGVAVLGLIQSPLAKGLFQRSMITSGPVEYEQGYFKKEDMVALSRKWGDSFGCSDAQGPEAYRQCIKAVGDKNPLALQQAGGFGKRIGDREPFTSLGHSLMADGDVLPYVTSLKALREGKYSEVPLMIGSNSEEGFTGPCANPLLFGAVYPCEKLKADLAKAVLPAATRISTPEDWRTVLVELHGKDAGNALYKAYPPAFNNPWGAVGDYLTDSRLECGARATSRIMAARQDSPIYRYLWEGGVFGKLLPLHGVDIPYWFGGIQGMPGLATAAERGVSVMMGRYLGAFVRTGNPNGVFVPEWRRFGAVLEDTRFISGLDLGGKMVVRPHAESCDALAKVFPELTGVGP